MRRAGKLTFDLSHSAQVLLEAIVKLGGRDRLEVTGVNPAGGRGVAAFAHAGVVAQPTFVQVRVSQGVLRRDPLGLETKHTRMRRDWQKDEESVGSDAEATPFRGDQES